MSDINPGDVVRVTTSPGFTNSSGVVADPTTVTLKWFLHGGTVTTWVFGTDDEVVKDSTGIYHADIPVSAEGVHYYRWEGTGTVAAAEEGYFTAGTYFP